ncbi:integral membrane protein Pth11-like, putative [Beauveria bassiana ARSEF 2860]|uniref:Integral membrane protein Pth11-like, putative n=1 Tax=Beauveria bassiana (strain ARSEF 2860) TaxID=655819 RepID=J4UJR4_BEAB2|nr:integral membrane protein Pth11-like, putative [Beauveria bassiana ARSEF 2860]EJP64202.1 integral membrane protein Pth11-like, putative [Beauveria bassiana ARSEF 2860]
MLYSDPPPLRPFSEAKPTLLVSWWITLFCTCIILLRLAGRYIRVEKLFREDKIVALALVPLFLRIACAHVVLLWGANNVDLDGVTLSDAQLSHRVTGSRVVLAGRVFYAATLWTLKLTTLEFLTRLAGASMKKIYLRLTMFLRYALGVSFIAVLITNLAVCHPIAKSWQLTPDPGGQCRQGFVQLITMGAASAVLDIILIVFPVPLILSTRIPTKRKVLLVMLFCFGFLTVGITLYRVPQIIKLKGDQIFRSMWASVEILAATVVANIVALGSFLRDSGAKKTKFRPGYHSSGTTSRGGHGVTTGATWEDVEHAKSQQQQQQQQQQPRKTDSDEWLNDLDPRPRRESMRRMNRYSSHSLGNVRGPSPTASHDSLIRQERSYHRGHAGGMDMSAPRPPPAAVMAGSGGF